MNEDFKLLVFILLIVLGFILIIEIGIAVETYIKSFIYTEFMKDLIDHWRK